MLTYSGDPKIYIDENGADLIFEGGQPSMDEGVENRLQIALFTEPGWPGNTLFDDPVERIGSNFLGAVHQPITVQSLNNIRDAAKKALADGFGDTVVNVSNPMGRNINVLIRLPGLQLEVLLTTKNGINWQYQIEKEKTI
jgi:hypothetical protein